MVRGRGYPPDTRPAGEPPSDDTAGEQAASLELSTPTPHVQQFLMPYWALNRSPAHDFAPVPAAKGRSGSPDSVIDLDLARDIGWASSILPTRSGALSGQSWTLSGELTAPLGSPALS